MLSLENHESLKNVGFVSLSLQFKCLCRVLSMSAPRMMLTSTKEHGLVVRYCG